MLSQPLLLNTKTYSLVHREYVEQSTKRNTQPHYYESCVQCWCDNIDATVHVVRCELARKPKLIVFVSLFSASTTQSEYVRNKFPAPASLSGSAHERRSFRCSTQHTSPHHSSSVGVRIARTLLNKMRACVVWAEREHTLSLPALRTSRGAYELYNTHKKIHAQAQRTSQNSGMLVNVNSKSAPARNKPYTRT